jgi:hypothetical protein
MSERITHLRRRMIEDMTVRICRPQRKPHISLPPLRERTRPADRAEAYEEARAQSAREIVRYAGTWRPAALPLLAHHR